MWLLRKLGFETGDYPASLRIFPEAGQSGRSDGKVTRRWCRAWAVDPASVLVKQALRGLVFRAEGKWYLEEWRDRVDPELVDPIDPKKYERKIVG